MRTALLVEREKTTASIVVRWATALLVLGILTMATSMALAATAGNEQVLAKLGELADTDGWDQLIGIVSMISAPASLLGFGVVLSWMVGREFADETIAGLFALPVSRQEIAIAKLGVFLGWAVAVAVLLTVGCALAGITLGYGVPGEREFATLLRLLGLVVLTGFLALPAAWAATLGRGLLPGIATTIVMIAVGQILTIAGTGAWLPIAAPALWALVPDEVSWGQLATVPALGACAALLTGRSWRRLQLDR
jgi:ABC-2 type transport system permease protein